MGVLVLVSPGGSPGVTTAALAMALTWPHPVLLAECDPAGGSVLAGMLQAQVPPGAAGLPLQVALAAQQDPAAGASSLLADSFALDGAQDARLLPAGPGPGTGRHLASAWPAVAAAFAFAGRDVIADCGRFDGAGPLDPLLASAAALLMVCRPTLRQAAAARPRLRELAEVRHGRGADGLLVVGDGAYGGGGGRELARELGVPVAGQLPADGEAAGYLSDGMPPRRPLRRLPLIQASRRLAGRLAVQLDAQPGPMLPVQAPA